MQCIILIIAVRDNKEDCNLERYVYEIYKSYQFDEYDLIVYDGIDDSLHIAYCIDNNYYSICQIDQWDSEIDRLAFEQSNNYIVFNPYKNVLGTSGIHIILWSGAAASNDFYIFIDEKSKAPELLISYCTGGFSAVDIDSDGEQELMSYGGGLPTNFFLIMKREGKLMKTDYLYYNDNPIFYKDTTNEFYIRE